MKSANNHFNRISIESDSGGITVENHPERYAELYKELAGLIGDAAVHKLWKAYGGVTITFPTRLYSREYTRQFVRENMSCMKPSDMAKELRLSERRIRQIIQEVRTSDQSSANLEGGGI